MENPNVFSGAIMGWGLSNSRLEKPTPEVIDSSISYIGEDDLRVSHIGVCTRKED